MSWPACGSPFREHRRRQAGGPGGALTRSRQPDREGPLLGACDVQRGRGREGLGGCSGVSRVHQPQQGPQRRLRRPLIRPYRQPRCEHVDRLRNPRRRDPLVGTDGDQVDVAGPLIAGQQQHRRITGSTPVADEPVGDEILPPEFYDRPRLDAALAVYDFGTVFRAIRCDQNWTQEQFGEFVDLSQARVSDIERGVRPLWDVRVV
ncbi:MAG: helix-turn-helix domain-containing protein, partial [Pseudonocardiaceae bacterium]